MRTQVKNAFYAQSGGVTSVINSSACGLIQTARENSNEISKVFAGKNGIIGALKEELIDTSLESDDTVAGLNSTPGGAFGSCRFKLGDPETNTELYQRLIDVFKAHNINYFFYNGGGDSQDTTNKIAKYSQSVGFPIKCIGIPKTVDNDLPVTDCCPGFGSVAKYVATSILEASLDVESMAATSTKVFILEVMGRHAGWIAAAAGLARENTGQPPHIILFPEIPFEKDKFISKVVETVKKYQFCSIVASEGIKYSNGKFLAEQGNHDAFGHAQLGGVAPTIAEIVKTNTGFKYHWAVSDYLQRSARHIASDTDVKQAYSVGKAALEFALEGKNAIMPIIRRISNSPYRWEVSYTDLSNVANIEKNLPQNYIDEEGYGITNNCREYMRPLIAGENYPSFSNGIPVYSKPMNQLVKRILNDDFSIG